MKQAWRYRDALLMYLQKWKLTPACLILVAAASFWMTGAAFEKLHLFTKSTDLVMEEAMESNGAWLMLWAAGETASASITTFLRTAKSRFP